MHVAAHGITMVEILRRRGFRLRSAELPACRLKFPPRRMNVFVVLAALCVAGCGGTPNLEISRTFQDAQQAFDHASTPEDFLRAAGLYQEILDSGFTSGAVLYNQGNAFMRAGQRGRAIAAYRQAQQFRPRDPYLRANLRYAIGSGAPVDQRNSVLDYVLFWQDWLGYAEKFYILFAAAALTFGFGMLFVLFRDHAAFKRLALVSLLLTIVFAGSSGYDWYRFDHVENGVLIHDKVIARKGNSDSYTAAFNEPLAEGTEFRVLEHRGDWLLIRLPGTQEGWVKRDAAVLF